MLKSTRSLIASSLWQCHGFTSRSQAAVLLAAAGSHASPVVLRIATAVPQGTAWARELSAFARDIKDSSDDAVELKVYFGGIAGSAIDTPTGAVFVRIRQPGVKREERNLTANPRKIPAKASHPIFPVSKPPFPQNCKRREIERTSRKVNPKE